ncbi:MAG TPA: hypothetical protein VHT21_16950 [Stellaceae bacterium]|nr:hypothetical protein [Stellaceae bacterium]
MRAARYIAALGSAGLAPLAAGFVLAQHTAPTDYHLVSEEVLRGLTQNQAAEVITHLAFAPAPSTTSSVGLECDGC